ncbi:hypothetical protein [Agrobacterium rosae]|uniref:hypothetical protein n=1 Tax=Agrobacterium rosae TaxID=1972867 RepID=UPI0011AF6806|nr:hypothetical protein [Agrobacterium rosae]
MDISEELLRIRQRRYGQILRGTNGIYVVWDLEKKVAYSCHLYKRRNWKGSWVFYQVGSLINFYIENKEVKVLESNLQIEQLPSGLAPLITVTNDPNPPDPTSGETSVISSPNLKRASRR